MKTERRFTSEKLLAKKFKTKENGYDPYEVDFVLDQVIEDYKAMEAEAQYDIPKLLEELADLRREFERTCDELEKEKSRIKYLPKDTKDIHIDNYELLLRIGKLETFIKEKLNINPDEIK